MSGFRSLIEGGGVRPRTAAVYAAVLAAGTALFFFIHWIGNQTPYETVRQRLEDEIAVNAGAADERYFDGARALFEWEFCEIALATVTGARRDGAASPIADAVVLRRFHKSVALDGDMCAEVRAAVEGGETGVVHLKLRYWYGNKAALAIGLRRLSVLDYHRLVLAATFGGWAALAAALAALGRRALIAGAPVVVLGIQLSGIVYFADAANGPATAWAVWSAAILALMMRRRAAAKRAPLFCFAAGMVSSYLWFFDGHNAIAAFLLGLVAWLGYSRLKAGGRARRAAGCVALWILGFAACVSLGSAIKISAEYGADAREFHNHFWGTVSWSLERAARQTLAGATGEGALRHGCPGCGDEAWQNFPVARDIRGLWVMTPLSEPEDRALLGFSAAALALAAAVAVWRAKRGDRGALHAVSWTAALTAVAAVQLFMPSDVDFRNARLAFIPLAACWVALALAAAESGRREVWAAAACLALLAAGGAALARPVGALALEREISGERPAVRSEFDVYLNQDAGRLIYRRDDCDDSDAAHGFFLEALPVDEGDLPERMRKRGYERLDFGGHFNFERDAGWERAEPRGGRCLFARDLPDYPIAGIETGQRADGVELWAAVMAGDMSVPEGEPTARGGVFDIYRDENRLAYFAKDCSEDDARGRFFLSVFPASAADLSDESRERGLAHNSLNFDFERRGAVWDGECLAVRALPGYEIGAIETGQFVSGEGELWKVRME